MVKGISRQVIVVQSPGEELFDQAIFILKDTAVNRGVTDEMLLKQARQAIRSPERSRRRRLWHYGPAWACGGALLTGLAWVISTII